MNEAYPEDINDKCPKCGNEAWMTIVDELQKHDLKNKEAYRLLHCDRCCSYFKEVWAFKKLVLLQDVSDNSKTQSLQDCPMEDLISIKEENQK